MAVPLRVSGVRPMRYHVVFLVGVMWPIITGPTRVCDNHTGVVRCIQVKGGDTYEVRPVINPNPPERLEKKSVPARKQAAKDFEEK